MKTLTFGRYGQRGSTLTISMIMLVLLTLFVLSAINSSTINLRIAGNTQSQDEARAAAQQAIETFVSSYANFYPAPAASAATTISINNHTSGNYTVTRTAPVCKSARQQIPARTVDCINGQKAGLVCWDTIWEISATATNTSTGVAQTVTQGVTLIFPPQVDPATLGC
jgi:Tfp pilus assembly protein PilX